MKRLLRQAKVPGLMDTQASKYHVGGGCHRVGRRKGWHSGIAPPSALSLRCSLSHQNSSVEWHMWNGHKLMISFNPWTDISARHWLEITSTRAQMECNNTLIEFSSGIWSTKSHGEQVRGTAPSGIFGPLSFALWTARGRHS